MHPGRHARSPSRDRRCVHENKNSWPLRGSRLSISRTCSDRPAKPFLMSVWPVASQTRTPVGSGIMATFQARAGSAAGPPPQRHYRPVHVGRSRSRSQFDHNPIRHPLQTAPPRSSPVQIQPARQVAPRDTPWATKTKADWKSRADAPSQRQPWTRKALLDDANLCFFRPSTAPTRVNNLKTTDRTTVSKAIHTDSQLHLAQFDKAAYTG